VAQEMMKSVDYVSWLKSWPRVQCTDNVC